MLTKTKNVTYMAKITVEEMFYGNKYGVMDEVIKLMAEAFLQPICDDEQTLIQAIYFDEMSERDYAKKTGVYRNAIHKKKVRILEKLKKILEN